MDPDPAVRRARRRLAVVGPARGRQRRLPRAGQDRSAAGERDLERRPRSRHPRDRQPRAERRRRRGARVERDPGRPLVPDLPDTGPLQLDATEQLPRRGGRGVRRQLVPRHVDDGYPGRAGGVLLRDRDRLRPERVEPGGRVARAAPGDARRRPQRALLALVAAARLVAADLDGHDDRPERLELRVARGGQRSPVDPADRLGSARRRLPGHGHRRHSRGQLPGDGLRSGRLRRPGSLAAHVHAAHGGSRRPPRRGRDEELPAAVRPPARVRAHLARGQHRPARRRRGAEHRRGGRRLLRGRVRRLRPPAHDLRRQPRLGLARLPRWAGAFRHVRRRDTRRDDPGRAHARLARPARHERGRLGVQLVLRRGARHRGVEHRRRSCDGRAAAHARRLGELLAPDAERARRIVPRVPARQRRPRRAAGLDALALRSRVRLARRGRRARRIGRQVTAGPGHEAPLVRGPAGATRRGRQCAAVAHAAGRRRRRPADHCGRHESRHARRHGAGRLADRDHDRRP